MKYVARVVKEVVCRVEIEAPEIPTRDMVRIALRKGFYTESIGYYRTDKMEIEEEG